MMTKLLAVIVAAGIGWTGLVLTKTNGAQSRTCSAGGCCALEPVSVSQQSEAKPSCCYPGSPCCYPGSPCCDNSCCPDGACCPDGTCCTAGSGCCSVK
jgi:hypothetical protein